MNKDLRDYDQKQLDVILAFTQKLVEHSQTDERVDFDVTDVDLDGCEKQAREFVARRKAGYRNSEIKGDGEIRKGIKSWLKRTGRISRDSV